MRTIGAGSWWSASFRFDLGDVQASGTKIVEVGGGQPRTAHGPPGWVVRPVPSPRAIDLDAVRASHGIIRA
jgi:hypothetical protein